MKTFKEISKTFPDILYYSNKYLEPDKFERIKRLLERAIIKFLTNFMLKKNFYFIKYNKEECL